VTKAAYEQFVSDLHHLSLDIGIRPAARAMGISEDRARKISSRRRFNLVRARCNAVSGPPSRSPNVTGIEAKAAIVQHYGDRAKIGATIAGAKALEHLADSTGADLVKPAAAISGDQWTKAVDRAAGWTAARQQGTTVQVAVITPPSEAERAAMDATDAKLDEITALLRAKRAGLPPA